MSTEKDSTLRVNPIHCRPTPWEAIDLIEDYRMCFVLGAATEHIVQSAHANPDTATVLHHLHLAGFYLERAVLQCENGQRRHYGFQPTIPAKDFCEFQRITGQQATAIECICDFAKFADVDFGNAIYAKPLKLAIAELKDKIRELS